MTVGRAEVRPPDYPQVGEAPPTQVEAPSPPPESAPAEEPRRLSAGRLVAVELALVVVLLAVSTRSVPVIAVAAGLAVLVLVPLFLRVQGKWWTQSVAARTRLRRRAGVPVAPGYTVATAERDGAVFGVGSDDDGWFAAVALEPTTDLAGRRSVAVPLARLARLLTDGLVPVSAVQVVSWTVPAPHYLLSRQVPAFESYRQLSTDLRGAVAPATGLNWAVLRFDNADAIARTDGGTAAAHRVLGVGLRRLGTALTAGDVRHQPATAEQLAGAVATCVGLDRVGDGPPSETWAAWSGGGLAHAAFEVVDWPSPATPDLLAEVAYVPAAQVVWSVDLRRAPSTQDVTVRGLVRVSAVPARLDDALRILTGRAEQFHLRLRRLDGAHGPAGYACAPTGGAPW